MSPAIALGQAPGLEPEKVSNDQPGRPLQMSPASTEVKEAFDDFERFRRRGAWERALKALYTVPREQASRFVDGKDGFIVSVARKRRSLLSSLPPEGQAAYRLFYDAEAKKLLDEAEGPSELEHLERLYSAYFATSVGDNAADRLGDLYYELGRFDRAADCWLAVLRECPDTDLSPGLIAVKAALALARAGRRSEYLQVRGELKDRDSGEAVTIGGRTGRPAEVLRQLVGDDAPGGSPGERPAGRAGAGLDLSGPPGAAWQLRFGASVVAGMTPAELTQWESNPLSAVVPAVAVEGTTLYANYLGYVFALDLGSGKMLWRSAAFHNVDASAMQDQARFLDASRFAVVASGEFVWSLGRDLKDQNFMAPFRLTCRRADGGDVVWQSADLPDYAQLDLVGPPLLAGGRLFIAAKGMSQERMPQQFVLAIRPRDGELLWKAEVGAFRQGQQYYFYYGAREAEPQPQLIYRAGTIYVDTHVGVLARLDADSGEVDWGFAYETDPAHNQGRFFFFGYPQVQESATACGRPVEVDAALLVKGVKSGRVYSVEPDRMALLWDRPIAKSARLLGVGDGGVAFLGGPELGALDLKTRKLLWATRLPGGSAVGRLLVRPDGLWQMTPRGVFEVDPRSGSVRRIFRGEDTGASGGDLFLTDRLLVTVSNRTIAAYPRRPAGREDAASTQKGTTDD